MRNGMADGLQRYKCRTCGKAFNALTGTPLARLRHKGKWLEQTRALADGLIVHRAAEFLAGATPVVDLSGPQESESICSSVLSSGWNSGLSCSMRMNFGSVWIVNIASEAGGMC